MRSDLIALYMQYKGNSINERWLSKGDGHHDTEILEKQLLDLSLLLLLPRLKCQKCPNKFDIR